MEPEATHFRTISIFKIEHVILTCTFFAQYLLWILYREFSLTGTCWILIENRCWDVKVNITIWNSSTLYTVCKICPSINVEVVSLNDINASFLKASRLHWGSLHMLANEKSQSPSVQCICSLESLTVSWGSWHTDPHCHSQSCCPPAFGRQTQCCLGLTALKGHRELSRLSPADAHPIHLRAKLALRRSWVSTCGDVGRWIIVEGATLQYAPRNMCAGYFSLDYFILIKHRSSLYYKVPVWERG